MSPAATAARPRFGLHLPNNVFLFAVLCPVGGRVAMLGSAMRGPAPVWSGTAALRRNPAAAGLPKPRSHCGRDLPELYQQEKEAGQEADPGKEPMDGKVHLCDRHPLRVPCRLPPRSAGCILPAHLLHPKVPGGLVQAHAAGVDHHVSVELGNLLQLRVVLAQKAQIPPMSPLWRVACVPSPGGRGTAWCSKKRARNSLSSSSVCILRSKFNVYSAPAQARAPPSDL